MPKTIYSEREKQPIQACEIVNADPEVRQIEAEFDALSDEISHARTLASRFGTLG